MQKWQNLTQFLAANQKNQNQNPDTRLVGDIYKELETKLDQQVNVKNFVLEKNNLFQPHFPILFSFRSLSHRVSCELKD